jgi:ubiquitin carboxyl-terminal hydrolase 8
MSFTLPLDTRDINKYENRGLSGMANLGNSCYLNSCMQLLSHTYELNEFLSKDDKIYKHSLKRIPESIILLEWDKLRDMLWSNNCIVAPYSFIKTVQHVARLKQRDIFSGHDQNDLQEFLLFIIDCFHTALSREVDMNITGNSKNEIDDLAVTAYKMMKNMYKKDHSDILTIFYGIHVSQITTMHSENVVSMSAEPFSVISLSIPLITVPTLFDCFDLYCGAEVLDGENAWFNDKTGTKEPAKRRIVFWSLPNIMIIDLKRSKVNNKKLHTRVDIPINNVDFSRYVKGYNSESYIYDLYGVCNHSGGGGAGGHYTAYIKNANNNWYNFNDTAVNMIPEDKIISAMSYCLFYRKKK